MVRSVEELCREYGISKGTFYPWRNKFEDVTISANQRLKPLESENGKLKRSVAEQALDILALADILNDKVISWFEQEEISVLRVLTDRGTEYCGVKEHHEY